MPATFELSDNRARPRQNPAPYTNKGRLSNRPKSISKSLLLPPRRSKQDQIKATELQSEILLKAPFHEHERQEPRYHGESEIIH